MSQLTFQWPAQASFAREDFFLSPGNAQAAHLLDSWPQGASSALLLSGPEASGKTHLATGWASRYQAVKIAIKDIGIKTSAVLWKTSGHALLEDIHLTSDEVALFHLLRHAEAEKGFLLLTARACAAQLPFRLPDLRSRLMAMPSAAITPPDEALLKAFLAKCFSDRQLRVSEEVIAYLSRHVERSFAAALRTVELLERKAFEAKREITIPFVKSF